MRTYHGDLTGEVFRLRHRKQTVRRLPEPLGGNVVRRLIDKPLLHVGVV
ncbi:MAG: hypothetical protein GTO26_11675 [Planctomycetales bacterium]|nr:hypothetical protein [Planctomycetales bacterium]